jgi:ABC-2 type transport system ATP-binding protein
VAWELIRRIQARGTTVILVTHFMDEAETLCDRLVVIDHGIVIAGGTPQGLIDEHGGGVNVQFTAPGPQLDWLSSVPYVESVERQKDQYEVRGTGPLLAHVAAALGEHGQAPSDLRLKRATLEEVFLRLTSADSDPT